MKILCQSIFMLLSFSFLSPLLSQVDCDTVADLGIEIEIVSPNFPDPNIYAGDEFCINFICTDLTNITLFQFSLGFDPNVISYIDNGNNPVAGPNALNVTVSVNKDNVNQGKLPIIWQHDLAEATTLADGDIVMTAKFRADSPGDCSEAMPLGEFTNNPPFQTFATADYNSADPLGSGVCGDIAVIFNPGEEDICIDCERVIVTNVGVCASTDKGCLTFSSCGGAYPVDFEIISGGPSLTGQINFEGEIIERCNLSSGLYVIELRDANGDASSRTVQIDRTNPTIELETTIVNPRCSTTNDGEIQYTVTGGMPDYNLKLSNGLNFQNTSGSMDNLINGSYDVTVTDGLGCEEVFENININTPPIVLDIEVDSFACLRAADGQIRVKASGGTPFNGNQYEFNNTMTDCWIEDDPMNVSFVFNEVDTCFNLEVRDSRGCPLDTCIRIPLRSSFSFDFDTIPPTCNELGYTSTITITSADRYLISLFTQNGDLVQTFGNNTFQETLEELAPGNYRWELLELMGDDCIENVEFTIPVFSVSPIQLTTDAVQPECGQENGSATISIVSGTPPYNYSWEDDPGNNSGMLSNLGGGIYNVTITDGRNCEKDTFVDLTLGSQLLIAGNINRDLDCNDSSITAELEVMFSGFPASELTFEWYTETESNLGATPLLETDTAGVYIIEVNTLAGDCLLTDTLEILAPGTLTYQTVIINPASCDPNNLVEGSIEIINITGGSGLYNCRWHIGDLDTPFGPITDISCDRNNLDAGLYLIEIVDNMNGCKTVVEVDLFNDDNVTFEPVLTPPTCPGDADGSISIGGIVGGPTLTCTWADPDVVAIGCLASNLMAGSYTVNITDENNCEKDTTFILNDPDIFTAEVTDSTGTSCWNGADGAATVVVSSNPAGLTDFTFLWSNGDQDQLGTTATNMALEPGANTVSVLDGNCALVLDFSIPEPTPVTLNTDSFIATCVGAEAIVDLSASGGAGAASGYTYSWELDGSNQASRNDLGVGEYVVSITDGNLCEFSDTLYITEPDSLFLDLVEVIGLGCDNSGAGGSVTVGARGGCSTAYSYTWPGNVSDNASASGLDAGSYLITVTDDCGCTDIAEAVIAGVTPISAEIEVSGLASCPGDLVCLGINQETISGGTGTGYRFNITGGLGPAFPIDTCFMVPPGPYAISIFDSESCQLDLGIVNVMGPNPFSVSLGDNIEAELGDGDIELTAEIINTTPVVNISWMVDEEWECIDPSYCDMIAFTPTTNSFVIVVVTDENGCTVSDNLSVNLTANRLVYFPTAFLPDSDIDNRFMLQTGRGVESIEDFIIYDKWGNKMFELPEQLKDFPHSKDDGWDGRKNNRNCEAGVYVWIANVRFSDGLIIPYEGQITLIR